MITINIIIRAMWLKMSLRDLIDDSKKFKFSVIRNIFGFGSVENMGCFHE